MKAIGILSSLPTNDPGCFAEVEAPDPVPGAQDLLVRIKAVSVNPVDYKVRQGAGDALAEPMIIGWDAAGVVEAVGPDVRHFSPGDEVMYAGAIDRPGCFAQRQVVDERIVGRKPLSFSFEQAAAVPLTALTAWESLFDGLRLGDEPQPGKSLLVIGGAGGVGSMAIQLAGRIPGLTVIATASRQETQDWCTGLGAHHVVDHSGNLAGELAGIGHGEVDFILNCNDNLPYWQFMADAVAPQGRVCLLSSTRQAIDLDIFMHKSVSVCWEYVFCRSEYATPDMSRQRDILNNLADLFESGDIRSTLTRDLGPLTAASAAEAHALLEQRSMIGKLALSAIA